jgi:hypothetical protein
MKTFDVQSIVVNVSFDNRLSSSRQQGGVTFQTLNPIRGVGRGERVMDRAGSPLRLHSSVLVQPNDAAELTTQRDELLPRRFTLPGLSGGERAS